MVVWSFIVLCSRITVSVIAVVGLVDVSDRYILILAALEMVALLLLLVIIYVKLALILTVDIMI